MSMEKMSFTKENDSPITKFYLDLKKEKKCKIFGNTEDTKRRTFRDFIYVEDCNKIAIWLFKKTQMEFLMLAQGNRLNL